MRRRKEEVMAAALWAFVEQLRANGDPLAVGLDRLTPTEAEELSSLLRFAQSVQLALEETGEAPVPTAAQRVRTAIAAHQGTGRRVPFRRRLPLERGKPGLIVHSLQTVVLTAAALLAGVAVGRHLPPPDPLSHPPAAVAVLTHEQARAYVPRLFTGRLATAQSRAVLWHLAHCQECFAAYRQMHGSILNHRQEPSSSFVLSRNIVLRPLEHPSLLPAEAGLRSRDGQKR